MSTGGGQAGFDDGQTAERAQLDPLAFAPPAPKATPRTGSDLHICAGCGSGLVYPIDWAPADERNWAVEVRCPDCEWVGSGVYSQATVDMFDVELDRGTDMLIEDLARLTRANMEEETERFISALVGDHILPEDF
ncbi:MAG: hypothetical protein ACRDL1_12650 [Solirubrobacterales bacterium]